VRRGNPPSCHCENCKAIRGNLIQHNLFFRIPNIVIARSTKCNAAIPLLVIARIAKQFVAISFNITYSFVFLILSLRGARSATRQSPFLSLRELQSNSWQSHSTQFVFSLHPLLTSLQFRQSNNLLNPIFSLSNNLLFFCRFL